MSGIYIPGVEMPSYCAECRFLSEYGDYPVCIITDEQRGYNFRVCENRMPHCPLVPVPEHGRLGDLDELKRVVKANDWSNPTVPAALNVIITRMSTIIPADPAKEGEG